MSPEKVTETEGTAEKAQPMWGNALYQKRARRVFPLLVNLARGHATATYAEIARQLKMASPRNLNYVLGSVGASLTELSKKWDELIPPIEALVVSSETDLPGSGVDHFLSRAGAPISSDRRAQIEQAHKAIYAYQKWPEVQKALRTPPDQQHSEIIPGLVNANSTKHWWVNHKQTHRQEVEGEYLWSPKRNQNGAQNVSYDNMAHVMPGDVVFSFADAAIRAIGVALGRAREAPKPLEFGAAGEQWGTDAAWQVPVRFRELERPFRTQDHAAELAPVLPAKYSPIRANGKGNQGTYLAAVPMAMVARLHELLAGQIEVMVESITQTVDKTLAEDVAEAGIEQRTDIGPTEKLNLVKSRRGQGVYRTNLEQIEKACRVTGVADRRLLRASHIKPWCKCDDLEKLDGFNGLLLSPHIDHLFDGGFISFSDTGEVLLSKALDLSALRAWGLTLPFNVGAFRSEQCKYLAYHQEHVFEKGRFTGSLSRQNSTRAKD
jgi:putative restriction endonuclease